MTIWLQAWFAWRVACYMTVTTPTSFLTWHPRKYGVQVGGYPNIPGC